MQIYLVLNSGGGKLHRQYTAALVDAGHAYPLVSFAEFTEGKGCLEIRPDLWSRPNVEDLPSSKCV